jgi:methylmalonyl-CoA/ethylmalonyl-CoA epimerase
LAAAGVGIGRLNHIALAVPDLDKAVSLYRDVLGAKVSAPEVCLARFITIREFSLFILIL